MKMEHNERGLHNETHIHTLHTHTQFERDIELNFLTTDRFFFLKIVW